MRALCSRLSVGLLLLALAPALPGCAQAPAAGPTRAEPAADLSRQTVTALANGSAAERTRTEAEIRANPGRYAPPVLFALSHALFARGEKDEAAFWFYAAQLRTRFDANRTTSAEAGTTAALLTDRFGPPINQYSFQDLARLEALVLRVVEWDRKTPHDYEANWIGPPRPREEWSRIAEETRADYLKGLRMALGKMRGDPASTWEIADGKVVYHAARGPRVVAGADTATFQVLSQTYGRDASRVYWLYEVVEGADPASFTPIDDHWGRDAQGLYRRTARFPGADPKTFRAIDETLYADDGAVYPIPTTVTQTSPQ